MAKVTRVVNRESGEVFYFGAEKDPFRIYGLGMISFSDGKIYYEDGEKSRNIQKKELFELDQFCRSPGGLSKGDLEAALTNENYEISNLNKELKLIRQDLLKDKKPFKHLIYDIGSKRYKLVAGSPGGLHITLSDILRAINGNGVNVEEGCYLLASSIIDATNRHYGHQIDDATKIKEFVDGNALHIKENLQSIYSRAGSDKDFNFHWDEEKRYLEGMLKEYEDSVPTIAEGILVIFPEIRKKYYTYDGNPADTAQHPYDILTSLCFIAIYEASEFLALSDRNFDDLRKEYRNAVLARICSIYAEDADAETVDGPSPSAVASISVETEAIEMPAPFACSNHWTSMICDELATNRDSCTLSFDYGRVQLAGDREPWVSLVYKFDRPQNVAGKRLCFDLNFGNESNFDRVDVEFKRPRESEYRAPSLICRKDDEGSRYGIDCSSLEKDVRTCLGEICFVVRAAYAENMADILKVKGSFTVKWDLLED